MLSSSIDKGNSRTMEWFILDFTGHDIPPGIVNIANGLGSEAGVCITEHKRIEKVAFTDSMVVGCKIMEMAVRTNLQKVTLKLGEKNPNIIFNAANV